MEVVLFEQWKKGPWLFRLYRGLLLPNYMGILISQYKDPYKPTRIQWKVGGFFCVAHLLKFTIRINQM